MIINALWECKESTGVYGAGRGNKENRESKIKWMFSRANRPADFIFCWPKQKDAAQFFFFFFDVWLIILVPIHFSFSPYLIKISF